MHISPEGRRGHADWSMPRASALKHAPSRGQRGVLGRPARLAIAAVEVVQALLVVRYGPGIGRRIFGIRLAQSVVHLVWVVHQVVVFLLATLVASVDLAPHAQHVPFVGRDIVGLQFAKDGSAGPDFGPALSKG